MIALQTKRHNPVTYHRLRPFTKLGLPYYWIKDGMRVDTTHLITNNAYFPHFLEEIKKLRKQIGFKFVMDVDDYWIVDSWNPVAKELKGDTLKARIETMKAADILTTTHDRLALKLTEINPTADIVIIPNGLDHTDPQWQAKEVDNVSFGYIAGPTHKRDIDALKGAQRKIDILAPDYFKSKLNARRTFPYRRTDEYGYLYDLFTVSLAPIFSTEFTALKSDLKAVEAGFKNRMLIAQRAHPYLDNDAIMHKESYSEWNSLNKLTVSEVQEWAGKLNEWALENRKLERMNEIRKQIIEG